MQELSPKAKVSYDDQKFEVEFDVREFRPEELSIKTDGDVLVVLAKHETKTESGGSFVSKQFEQRFTLPSGVREAFQCCREIRVSDVIVHNTLKEGFHRIQSFFDQVDPFGGDIKLSL